MRGEVKVKAGGKEHVLRLTLGALEEATEGGVAVDTAYGALKLGLWTIKEASAVVRAAIAATAAEVTAEQLFDELGSDGFRDLATELLEAVKSGNAKAAAGAAKKAKAAASP